ncbi:HTH domain-containing protein [Bacteroides stercoris]|jgi:predicted DNA-binding transcriptional regulator YafY|uniref:HTH domain-containing protein n=1 Tax=Bacteroides stercoris TaxID=46506 RepID=A0A3E4UL28_BACSE|nr:HTH domain-containing protein [Bacteroides stercoris]RGM11264.1 HTH domain-containing protein [Bacteroides stercoris]
MNTLVQLHRILELHQLIRSERTGHYTDLAAKLHVSVRTISNYFDELREMGAKIGFDELHTTYYYKNGFDMVYRFEIKVSSTEDNMLREEPTRISDG